VDSLETATESLRRSVENDPRANELAQLGTLGKGLMDAKLPKGFIDDLSSYIAHCRKLRASEYKVFDLLRLKLYEEGQKVLSEIEKTGDDPNVCPLCGSRYEGDLLEHVAGELGGLAQLKQMRDEISESRELLAEQVADLESGVRALSTTYEDHSEPLKRLQLSKPTTLGPLVDLLEQVGLQLGQQPEDLSNDDLKEIASQAQCLATHLHDLEGSVKQAIARVKARGDFLRKDSTRAQLVQDHQTLTRALEEWAKVQQASNRAKCMTIVQKRLACVIQNYVESSTEDVQRRFQTISDNVARYFRILEQDNSCLSQPVLRLMSDQDRAVELEVRFYGKPICPAYKFLSESQLSSFGLAVFLASTRQFNLGFRFLVLDDVINSFDGYKRPRVIELLRNEFADYQVLLFTHDNMWYDQLCDKCPGWIRRRFRRLERGIGPIDSSSVAGSVDRVKELIDDDRPTEAGIKMGVYLERQLQELCESFRVLVTYNRRNEYTLMPLLERFQTRVKDKLGREHELYQTIESLREDAGFRNFCAHWKDPDIQITSQEIRDVVTKWEVVHSHVFCPQCGRYAAYDGEKSFRCECPAISLVRTT